MGQYSVSHGVVCLLLPVVGQHASQVYHQPLCGAGEEISNSAKDCVSLSYLSPTDSCPREGGREGGREGRREGVVCNPFSSLLDHLRCP